MVGTNKDHGKTYRKALPLFLLAEISGCEWGKIKVFGREVGRETALCHFLSIAFIYNLPNKIFQFPGCVNSSTFP